MKQLKKISTILLIVAWVLLLVTILPIFFLVYSLTKLPDEKTGNLTREETLTNRYLMVACGSGVLMVGIQMVFTCLNKTTKELASLTCVVWGLLNLLAAAIVVMGHTYDPAEDATKMEKNAEAKVDMYYGADLIFVSILVGGGLGIASIILLVDIFFFMKR